MNLLTIQHWFQRCLLPLIFQLNSLFFFFLQAFLDLTGRVEPKRQAKLGPVLGCAEDFIDGSEGGVVGRGAPPPPIFGIDRPIGTRRVSALAFRGDGARARPKTALFPGLIGNRADSFVEGRARYVPDQIRHCLKFVAIVELGNLQAVIVLSTRRLAPLLLSFLH